MSVRLHLGADDSFLSSFWTVANANSVVAAINDIATEELDGAGAAPVVSAAASIAALSAPEQALISLGVIVTVTDGTRWQYTGTGSKVLEASYVQLSDVTPTWDSVAGKPATFPPETHSHAYADITAKPSTFAPATHASAHASGGGDPIKLDDLAAPDDNTDRNASITAHGLLPKLPNDATKVLNGVGGWARPVAPLTDVAYVDAISGNDTTGDGSIGAPFLTAEKACQDGFNVLWISGGDAGVLDVDQIPGTLHVYGGGTDDFMGADSGDINPQWFTGGSFFAKVTLSNINLTTGHVHVYSNNGVIIDIDAITSELGGVEFKIHNATLGAVAMNGGQGAAGTDDFGEGFGDGGAGGTGAPGGVLTINQCTLLGPCQLNGGYGGPGGLGFNAGNGGAGGNGGRIYSYNSLIACAVSLAPGAVGTPGTDTGGAPGNSGAEGTAGSIEALMSVIAVNPSPGTVNSRGSVVEGNFMLNAGAGYISPTNGGTGVANNAASTLTRVGNHALTLTTTGVTNLTLPTSGTVATTDDTNKPYVCVVDQKTNATAGGATTGGSAITRDLNTVRVDTHGIASVSSNEVTIPAGTYRFRFSAPGYNCNAFAAWLYNATDAADVTGGQGVAGYAYNYTLGTSYGSGRITIAGSKAFTIKFYSQASDADGLGRANFAAGVPGPSVFTMLEFWKE